MEIGKNIRERRIQCGMTQKDLAEKLGLSQIMVSHFERGTKIPSLYNAMLMAGLFGCTVEDLVGGGIL